MTAWRALDADALRDLVTRLRGLSWQWQASELPAVADKLGWRLTRQSPGGGASASTGEFGGREVTVVGRDGAVQTVSVRVSDSAGQQTPEGRAFLRDAFADSVDALTHLLGTPTKRRLGDRPTVRWRDDELTVSVIGFGNSILLTIAPTAVQDHLDRAEGGSEW
jgi:hypothetical protein